MFPKILTCIAGLASMYIHIHVHTLFLASLTTPVLQDWLLCTPQSEKSGILGSWIPVGFRPKLGKLRQDQESWARLGKLTQKFHKIRKTSAKLGKIIRKIRKSLAKQENLEISLGKTTGYQESSPPILGKLDVRPEKKVRT